MIHQLRVPGTFTNHFQGINWHIQKREISTGRILTIYMDMPYITKNKVLSFERIPINMRVSDGQ